MIVINQSKVAQKYSLIKSIYNNISLVSKEYESLQALSKTIQAITYGSQSGYDGKLRDNIYASLSALSSALDKLYSARSSANSINIKEVIPDYGQYRY